jgi:zinc transport system ATP-binding protein
MSIGTRALASANGPAGDAAHAHAHHHGPHHAHDHACDHNVSDERRAVLIRGRGLALARGGRTILDGIDIDVAPGEIVTLIGPNGAGKTSLVRTLLGLEKPDAGAVERMPGLVIGYVPQRFDRDAAIPMTVARFLMLAAKVEPARAQKALD